MEDTSLSIAERRSYIALKVIGGTLSVVGSALVIYIVLRQRKATSSQRPTYHRFLLAMSVYDLIQAAWQGLGAVPVPQWTGAIGSYGNTATCTALGFFVTLALGGWIYNAGLSIYYVMVIRYRFSESSVTKYLEPIIHVSAFFFSMALGISGLYLTVFNAISPSPEVGCFAWPYPDTCFYDASTCQRGRYYGEWGWAFYAMQCLCVAIVMVMSGVLYGTIRKQYRSSSRYASGESTQMRERTRAVAWQAFMFALACFYANIWNILIVGTYGRGPKAIFKIVLLNGLFSYPGQGFFNFLIYIGPRYRRLRQRRPECGRLGALYEVIFIAQEGDNRRGSYSGSSRRRRSSGTFTESSKWGSFMNSLFGKGNNNNSGGQPSTSHIKALKKSTELTVDDMDARSDDDQRDDDILVNEMDENDKETTLEGKVGEEAFPASAVVAAAGETPKVVTTDDDDGGGLPSPTVDDDDDDVQDHIDHDEDNADKVEAIIKPSFL